MRWGEARAFRDLRCSHPCADANFIRGIKELALDRLALSGEEGGLTSPESLSSPSGDLAVTFHWRSCQGEELRAPPHPLLRLGGCRSSQVPKDLHSACFPKSCANGETAFPRGRKPPPEPSSATLPLPPWGRGG